MKRVIIQREVIERQFLVEASEGMSERAIHEQFFAQDVSCGSYFAERYQVDLDIIEDLTGVPVDAPIEEIA